MKTYQYYKSVFEGLPMPFAFVDRDLLDQNISDILGRAGNKKIRIATKSIRCRAVMDYILKSSDVFQGLMCYNIYEAAWLASLGYDDLLVAYPYTQKQHIESIVPALREGKSIYLMADLPEHLDIIEKIGKENDVTIPVCLDIDMSTKFPGIHFGVFRSSIRSKEDAQGFFKKIKTCTHLRLGAIMGYEAQIAGLGDKVKGKGMMNGIISFLKGKSIKKLATLRTEVCQLALDLGFTPEVVNGGGTGSMESTRMEDHVTEITVGSGFFASHLFDNYKIFKHQPAAAYAIEIVRKPESGILTCAGGGYVASGTHGFDKVPHPYLPLGATFVANEMAGEVQTPIIYKGKEKLDLGDPVFLRHSKAGELCKHFKELHWVSEGKITDSSPTYRGEGKCFL